MRPLLVIAGGLAIVVVDFRTELVDWLADPVGWIAVAYAARRLALDRVAMVALVPAILSLSDVRLPYHRVRIDPVTGEVVAPANGARRGYPERLVFDSVSGWRLAAMALAMAAAGVTVWLLLDALAGRARATRDEGAAGRLRLLQWLVPAAWVVPYLVGVVAAVAGEGGSFDPIWNGRPAMAATLVGLAAVAGLIVVLVRESGERWAVPPAMARRPSPWLSRRLGRRTNGHGPDPATPPS
jgi:hypothetical protein